MGFLLGLPLKLLALVFGLLRVLIPVLRCWFWSFAVAVAEIRRPQALGIRENQDEPHFKGPVYTVDYKEVKDDDRHKE